MHCKHETLFFFFTFLSFGLPLSTFFFKSSFFVLLFIFLMTPILFYHNTKSARFVNFFNFGGRTRDADVRSETSARLATLTAFASERGRTGNWLARRLGRRTPAVYGLRLYEARRVSSPGTRPPKRDARLGIKANTWINIPSVSTN